MSLLEGVSVVVTRAQHQTAELVERLEAVGAVPIVMPVIDVVAPDDHGAALRAAFDQLHEYDWLVITSANTVDCLPMFEPPQNLQIAAIGSGTAQRLQAEHYPVSLVPPEFVAESLLEVFPSGAGRVLLPRAAAAREVLPEGLRAKGWHVDVVDAYKTVDVQPNPEVLQQALDADVVTFTAPSTVRAFLKATGGRSPDRLIACIGPITEQAVVEGGMTVDLVATEHTIKGLVDAIVHRYQ
jgi:uroporphyrinogen III methyltransferase/synthase